MLLVLPIAFPPTRIITLKKQTSSDLATLSNFIIFFVFIVCVGKDVATTIYPNLLDQMDRFFSFHVTTEWDHCTIFESCLSHNSKPFLGLTQCVWT